ncbi:MAG: cell division protein ZipA [Sedimenticola sp.]|nr:MAG: cell division protein ZipA [Sedimenticola sp.]
MDADTLRLILFIAGVILILGIYFLGRKKRTASRIHATRKALDDGMSSTIYPEEPDDDLNDSFDEDEWRDEKIEPTFAVETDALADQTLDSLSIDEREESTPPPAPKKAEPPKQTTFSFSAEDPEDATDPILGSDLPVKIVVLNLIAKKGKISGSQLKQVCDEVELVHGEMQIYHRYADGDARQGKAIFSMANMVEPGTFPNQEIEDFETPGVILFAQLPGPKDGLATFSDMLFTAERMAAVLDAELQDETHSALSKQTIEHIREEILEHRRQVQLAKSKR